MYNPTTRLLSLLELLQMAPQVPGPELAAQLGVDVRTVRHYVTILQDAGMPIVSTTGRTGGYALRPGFKLPPLMFSDDEASAVTLGLLLVQHAGLAGSMLAATTALGKVERVLPTSVRERVQALQSVLVLDLATDEQRVEQTLLRVLSTAAQQNQQVQIQYTTGGQLSERVLDPYNVLYHRGRWYVIGYCHLRQAIRSFRLDRVGQALILESRFIRPANLSGRAALADLFSNSPALWQVDVLLALALDEAQRHIPKALARLEPHGTSTRMQAAVSDLEWMGRFLIGLGCPFTIQAPAELRQTIQRIALEVLDSAGASSPGAQADRSREQISAPVRAAPDSDPSPSR